MKAVIVKSRAGVMQIVDKEWTLKALQEAVGGLIENVSIDGRFVVYADEEARLKPQDAAFAIPNLTNGVILGDAVILGRNESDCERAEVDPLVLLPLVEKTLFYEIKRAV